MELGASKSRCISWPPCVFGGKKAVFSLNSHPPFSALSIRFRLGRIESPLIPHIEGSSDEREASEGRKVRGDTYSREREGCLATDARLWEYPQHQRSAVRVLRTPLPLYPHQHRCSATPKYSTLSRSGIGVCVYGTFRITRLCGLLIFRWDASDETKLKKYWKLKATN